VLPTLLIEERLRTLAWSMSVSQNPTCGVHGPPVEWNIGAVTVVE